MANINRFLTFPTGAALLEMDIFDDDPLFKSLVQDLVSLARAAQDLQVTPAQVSSRAVDKSWILLRRHALNHRFMSLPSADTLRDAKTLVKLREACRVAFIIWIGSFLFTSPVKSPATAVELHKFRTAQPERVLRLRESMRIVDWKGYEDLRLWMMTLATLSGPNSTILSSSLEESLRQLETQPDQQLRSCETIPGILRVVLFLGRWGPEDLTRAAVELLVIHEVGFEGERLWSVLAHRR